MKVFAYLPIALVVDDNVLCTHSAIPTPSNPLNGLLKLPKDLYSFERDERKVAHDIINRLPKWQSRQKQTKIKSASEKTGTQKSADFKSKTAEKSPTTQPVKSNVGKPKSLKVLKTTTKSSNVLSKPNNKSVSDH